MRSHSDVVRPEVLDLETDELAQRVRIKFWHALEDKHIDYPKTYIKRIVNSEFIDMVHRIKPNYTLDDVRQSYAISSILPNHKVVC